MIETVKNKGFTLVELSVVLIIIGFLIGAVVKGTSIYHQSNIKRILSDADRYRGFILAFKTKYDTFPGDLSNASSYWTGAANGDGNRKIEYRMDSDGTGTTDSTRWENYHAWKHLALSGVMQPLVNTTTANISTNGLGRVTYDIPQASIGTAGYWVETMGTSSGAKLLNTFGNLKVTLIVGIPYTRTSVANANVVLEPKGFLTATEAETIDKKIDDDLPKSGDVQSAPAYDSAADTCYMNASNAYNFSGAANTASTSCYIGISF